jgi:hypothetical protein
MCGIADVGDVGDVVFSKKLQTNFRQAVWVESSRKELLNAAKREDAIS